MPEPRFLAAVRESYDTVADAYAERVPAPTDMHPLQHAVLVAFADMVRRDALGPLADLGCGPGRVAAYLATRGTPVLGIDVSPEMIRLAREQYPDLCFREGSMTALDAPTAGFGGILAWYSTHHTPPEHLPTIFAEFARTLAPGGHLLLGGYLGDEVLHPSSGYGGLPVSYSSYLLPAARLVELMEAAGLAVTAQLVQKADERVRRDHACFLARRFA